MQSVAFIFEVIWKFHFCMVLWFVDIIQTQCVLYLQLGSWCTCSEMFRGCYIVWQVYLYLKCNFPPQLVWWSSSVSALTIAGRWITGITSILCLTLDCHKSLDCFQDSCPFTYRKLFSLQEQHRIQMTISAYVRDKYSWNKLTLYLHQNTCVDLMCNTLSMNTVASLYFLLAHFFSFTQILCAPAYWEGKSLVVEYLWRQQNVYISSECNQATDEACSDTFWYYLLLHRCMKCCITN